MRGYAPSQDTNTHPKNDSANTLQPANEWFFDKSGFTYFFEGSNAVLLIAFFDFNLIEGNCIQKILQKSCKYVKNTHFIFSQESSRRAKGRDGRKDSDEGTKIGGLCIDMQREYTWNDCAC